MNLFRASNNLTDFEKKILAEKYQAHMHKLKTMKPVVDCSQPKSTTRAAVYNKPKSIDPIFPARPAAAFDYEQNVRFKDTVDRLYQSVNSVKPFTNTWVDYDRFGTVKAKSGKATDIFFYDKYKQYLDPKFAHLQSTSSKKIGLELYSRPKTDVEKLLEAIQREKIKKPSLDYEKFVNQNVLTDEIIFLQKRREFRFKIQQDLKQTDLKTNFDYQKYFKDVFMKNIIKTNLQIILVTIIELGQENKVTDPTKMIEEQLEDDGYDIMCNKLEWDEQQ
ncbi:Hypothetical_protein [Hexamita inflata]|uniref:Hypothetical_protein n=1 Tax=Hexamita inflata TaxID=28002 RepID=A0AA86RGJ1_9EUKA|nr:Hypothetical protein HINF_LOCUS65075 [Hexamita inflata]